MDYVWDKVIQLCYLIFNIFFLTFNISSWNAQYFLCLMKQL